MRDNSWTVLTELDAEAPPARSLVLRAPRQEVQISVKFTATTLATLFSSLRAQFAKPNRSLGREMAARERRILAELKKRGAPQHVIEPRQSMPPASTVPTAEWIDRVVGSIEEVVLAGPLVTCTLKGQLPAPFPVRITPSKILLPRNNRIIGGRHAQLRHGDQPKLTEAPIVRTCMSGERGAKLSHRVRGAGVSA